MEPVPAYLLDRNVNPEPENVPDVNQAERLYTQANTPEYRVTLTPLNHNRMMIPPVQAIKANSMIEAIIQGDKASMRVDVPCGKAECKCKK